MKTARVGKKSPAAELLAAGGAVAVNTNHKITSPDFKTRKGAYRVELKSRTANRLKYQIVGVSKQASDEGYQRYLTSLQTTAREWLWT